MDKPTNQQSLPCSAPLGFIKVHRSLRESWVARDPHHLSLWTWKMMLAAFKAHSVILNGIPIKLEPGEMATSLRILASHSGIKKDKVKSILKNFEAYQMIRHWPNNKYTRIKLINWAKYQADPTQERHRPDRREERQRMETIWG